jgi:hypothetical protein
VIAQREKRLPKALTEKLQNTLAQGIACDAAQGCKLHFAGLSIFKKSKYNLSLT